MRKLIVLDVDGTLINSNGVITERTKKALIEAQKQGHKVVISSGRSPRGVMNFAKELKMDVYESYIANYNGAVVTDMKTMQEPINHKLTVNEVRDILQFADGLDIDYLIYYKDKVYVNSKDTIKLSEVTSKNQVEAVIIEDLSTSIDFEPNNILFSQDPSKIKEPSDILIEKYGNMYTTIFSESYFFEIMPKDVSKGSALLEIASYLGIAHEDTYAFGDNYNDLSMIEAAGNGVAMGNAVEDLKNKAKYITKSNNEDGIAIFIEKYILEK